MPKAASGGGRPTAMRWRRRSLASESTRCLRQLGDLEQTRQQAERIISLRPSHRTRSRAFGQLALASVLIAQQEPDQACGIAADVLNATQSLGFYLVISQLPEVLRPQHGVTWLNMISDQAVGLAGRVISDTPRTTSCTCRPLLVRPARGQKSAVARHRQDAEADRRVHTDVIAARGKCRDR
jgi:hypothetical protein